MNCSLFAKENVNAYYLEFDDARSGGFEPAQKLAATATTTALAIRIISIPPARPRSDPCLRGMIPAGHPETTGKPFK